MEDLSVSTTEERRLTYLASLTKIVKNTGIAGVGELFYTILVYILNLVISRFLGAEGIGIYAQAITITLLATLVARLGLDGGILRFISLYLARRQFSYLQGLNSFVSRLILLTGLLLGGGLFLSAGLLANSVLHEPQLIFVLRMFSITVPFLALTSTWLSGLQAFQRIDYRVLIERIFQPLVNLGLITVFLFLGWRWRGIAGAAILSTIAGSLLAYYVYTFVRRTSVETTAEPPGLEVREWLGFSYPLLLSGLLAFTTARIATVVLGSFRSSAEVGVYEIAFKIAQLVQLPLVVSNIMFAPMIGEIYAQGDIEKLQALFKIVTKWVFVASFPLFALSTLLAHPLLGIFGSEFVIGGPVLFLLAFGQLVNAGTGAVGWMLIMSGHSRLHLFNATLSALLTILFGYLLVPAYGMIGAAAAVGLTLVAVNILRLVEVFYLLKIHPYRWDFAKPVIAGLAAIGFSSSVQYLIINWDAPALWRFLTIGGTFLLLYITFLTLFQFNTDERELMKRTWQRVTFNRVPGKVIVK